MLLVLLTANPFAGAAEKLELFYANNVPVKKGHTLLKGITTSTPAGYHQIVLNLSKEGSKNFKSYSAKINGQSVWQARSESKGGITTLIVHLKEDHVQWGEGDKGKNTVKYFVNYTDGKKAEGELTVHGVILPEMLGKLISAAFLDSSKIKAKIKLPFEKAKSAKKEVPAAGKTGAEFHFEGGFAAALPKQEWEGSAEFGSTWDVGKVEVAIQLGGGLSGGMGETWTVEGAEISLGLGVAYNLFKWSAEKAIGKSNMDAIRNWPIIGKPVHGFLNAIQVKVTAEAALDAEVSLDVPEEGPITFAEGAAKIDLDVYALLKLEGPEILWSKVGLYAKAGGHVDFGGKFIKTDPVVGQLNFKLYVELGAYWNTFKAGVGFTPIKFTYNTAPRAKRALAGDAAPTIEIPSGSWSIVPPSDEPTVFPLVKLRPAAAKAKRNAPAVETVGAPKAEPSVAASLEAFAELTSRPLQELRVPRPVPMAKLRAAQPVVTESSVPLAENVLPVANPEMAAYGNELMVLFTNDTRKPGSNADSALFGQTWWTRYHEGKWSNPAPVAPKAKAPSQMEPSVVFDGMGRAIAGWHQVANAGVKIADPLDYLAATDLALAVFDPETGAWGDPLLIGTLQHGDYSARLAGPLENGDVVALYARTLIPPEPEVTAEELQAELRLKQWDSARARWIEEEVVLPLDRHIVDSAFAAKDDKVVLITMVDPTAGADPDPNFELRYRLFDLESRSWSEPTLLADASEQNSGASVMVTEEGDVLTAWWRGGSLMVQQNFAGQPITVLPADENATGFEQLHLAELAGGHVAIAWTEQTSDGPDMLAVLKDPVTSTWSDAVNLTPGHREEGVESIASDLAGNLVALFLTADVSFGPATVSDGVSGRIEIQNMPEVESRAVTVAKFRPFADKVFAEDGLSIEGETFAPGEFVTLQARIRNQGLLGIRSPRVSFYEGDPSQGGKLIGTRAASGVLEGGGEAEIVIGYQLPEEMEGKTLYASIGGAGPLPDVENHHLVRAIDLDEPRLRVTTVDADLDWEPEGMVARVQALVLNEGLDAAPVEVALVEVDSGREVNRSWTKALAPGEAAPVIFVTPLLDSGDKEPQYKLVIDPDKEVLEADEIVPFEKIIEARVLDQRRLRN